MKKMIIVLIFILSLNCLSFARVGYKTEKIGENTIRIYVEEEQKALQVVSYVKATSKALQIFYNHIDGDNYVDIDLRTMTPPIKITLVDLENIDGVLFDDLQGSKYQDYVKHLYDMNVVSGYEDDTFRAQNSVTRAEFATMILKAKGIDIKELQENPFSDINEHWAKNIILSAYDSGIIKGYEDGTFRPNDTVTLAEVVAMITKTFDFKTVGNTDVSIGEHWAKKMVTKMYEIEIIKENDELTELNKEMNRGDCAMLLSRAVTTR